MKAQFTVVIMYITGDNSRIDQKLLLFNQTNQVKGNGYGRQLCQNIGLLLKRGLL